MTALVFYEKPGCVGNQRQKAELRGRGVALQVRDLLSERWTTDGLRPFFGSLPVAEWFNLSAPQVKRGEVDIHACTEQQALQMMLAEPLLIRRPLLQFGDAHQAGFFDGPALAAVGIRLEPEKGLETCPMSDAEPACEVPR